MTASLLSSQDAIDAALKQDWKAAIKINTVLLRISKDDIESLSRLAYAYLMTGQLAAARRTYQKILTLDEYHQIALKNVQKLTTIKKKNLHAAPATSALSPLVFIEEPGKTKIVPCIDVAHNQILSTLSPGQEIQLRPKNHAVELRTGANVFLGRLPDDMSFKLLKLLSAGNTYQVVIKAVGKNNLTVLIHEISRGKRFAHQPSFTPTTSYVPFSKTTAGPAESGPDMTPTGEETDDAAKPVEL